MPYTTPLNLLNTFGDTEMALLASPENSAVDGVLLRLTVEAGDRSGYSQADIDAADQALVHIDAAIDSASRYMDSYISPRYSLPLDASLVADSSLADVCADITRHRLMDDRVTEAVENRFVQARAWLRDISMNKASLGEQDTGTATPQGRMVVKGGQSNTDWETF